MDISFINKIMIQIKEICRIKYEIFFFIIIDRHYIYFQILRLSQLLEQVYLNKIEISPFIYINILPYMHLSNHENKSILY